MVVKRFLFVAIIDVSLFFFAVCSLKLKRCLKCNSQIQQKATAGTLFVFSPFLLVTDVFVQFCLNDGAYFYGGGFESRLQRLALGHFS